MSKFKKAIISIGVFLVLLLVFKVEVVEGQLDEPGYTYIGDVLTGVLRVDAETGAVTPCVISDGKTVFCLGWK